MSLFDEFPHSITLQHVAYAQDDAGGDTRTPQAAYAANFGAFVQTADANDLREFAYRSQNVSHTIYVALNPGLQLDDVVTVLTGPYSGYVLRVMGFNECTAGLNRAWRIGAEVSRQIPA